MTDDTTSSRALTYEDLRRAFEQVAENDTVRVCPHVVHPKEMERGGWVRCASCFAVFELPTAASGGEG